MPQVIPLRFSATLACLAVLTGDYVSRPSTTKYLPQEDTST